MTLTLARTQTYCGSCRVSIPEDEPYAEVTANKLIRCLLCAGQMGFTVSAEEIAALKHVRALEQFAEQAEAAAKKPQGFTLVAGWYPPANELSQGRRAIQASDCGGGSTWPLTNKRRGGASHRREQTELSSVESRCISISVGACALSFRKDASR